MDSAGLLLKYQFTAFDVTDTMGFWKRQLQHCSLQDTPTSVRFNAGKLNFLKFPFFCMNLFYEKVISL